jgi:hypothetical protein
MLVVSRSIFHKRRRKIVALTPFKGTDGSSCCWLCDRACVGLLAWWRGVRKPVDPPGQMREDTMKSSQKRLLLLTGIVALAFVGPINAPAATVNIFDFSENENDPTFNVAGFIASSVLQQIIETASTGTASGIGVLTISGIYDAANPLPPGVSQTINFNMQDPGVPCCSDTLSITYTGRAPDNGNMMALVDFRSGSAGVFEGLVAPLPGGVLTGDIVNQTAFGLTVNAFSEPVPGPIVGAGLPGLILASGALLALARRRHRKDRLNIR